MKHKLINFSKCMYTNAKMGARSSVADFLFHRLPLSATCRHQKNPTPVYVQLQANHNSLFIEMPRQQGW